MTSVEQIEALVKAMNGVVAALLRLAMFNHVLAADEADVRAGIFHDVDLLDHDLSKLDGGFDSEDVDRVGDGIDGIRVVDGHLKGLVNAERQVEVFAVHTVLLEHVVRNRRAEGVILHEGKDEEHESNNLFDGCRRSHSVVRGV